jgi:hypothetical protein
MKSTLAIVFLFCCLTAKSQDDLLRYLGAHHYSFSPEKGFEGALADTLYSKLVGDRLILEAEGGSHYLTLYKQLKMDWLRFLHARMGLIHFIGEAGTSNAVLINKRLKVGDSLEQRLVFSGIDFERASTYIRGLKVLLPVQSSSAPTPSAPTQPSPTPSTPISAAIGLIRQAPDTGFDCDAVLRINDQLKKMLAGNESGFREYLDSAYRDFEKIVRNNGSCKDPLRNRNPHMADNFLTLDREVKAPVYFGEFGEAHTVLKNRDLASIINASPPFMGRVAVINLYCQDCSTPAETVSNWPLKGIEKDILRYFLPLCEGDFTLFDLSGPDPVVAPYRAYGQFLIVARGQH